MLLNQFPTIPAERIADLEAAFQSVFQTAEVAAVRLLAGGLSGSAVYGIELDGKHYTLKLNPAADAANVRNSTLGQAAAAGIAPKLYYDDPSKGIMISDFIIPQPVSTSFSPERLIQELAGTIKAIHQIPWAGNSVNVFEKVDELIAAFTAWGGLSGPVFDECFQRYENLKQRYPLSSDDEVFSHNDLNPNNILCDGQRLWVIDWDVAARNNRYIDLASAANFFLRTPEQEKVFLAAYIGYAPDELQLACFYTMRQVCRLLYALLMFRLAGQSKPVDYQHTPEMDGFDLPAFGALMGTGQLSLGEYEGQLFYGKALLNTAVAQMRADRFSASLELFNKQG